MRLLRLIKLTVWLSFLLTLQVSAHTYSQLITYAGREVPLEQVFAVLEKQTGFVVFYDYQEIADAKRVTVDVKKKPLKEFLDLCLKGQPLGYAIEDKTIMITRVQPSAPRQLDSSEAPRPPADVHGRVFSKNGEPLSGVTVSEKGTANATVTQADGSFTLKGSAPGAVLVFSYVGHRTTEVRASGRSAMEVVLEPAAQDMSTVVVTALGIKREKRSLGYSVANVEGSELTETPQTSVLNALSGKVAGVQISQMDGTAGSSVKILIRGATSLNKDNQPLFVIDGVPVANQLNNAFAGADMGNPVSDINPDDIATISVLKGPSAAALYGSRAANGVILITTKSGRGGKKGLGISVNTAAVMDIPYKYVPVQTKFASGKSGAHVLEESENENWGPRLDVGEEWVQWNSNGQKVPLISYPHRFQDFFQTGFTSTNNIGVSGNYDRGSFRASVGDVISKGVVPNTDLRRTTFALNTMYKMTDKLRITANFTVTESGSNNRPIIDGNRTSPVRSVYEMGANINIMDLRQYWLPGQEGIKQRKYKDKQNNPWFVAYENTTGFSRDRTAGKLQLDYDLARDWSLMARYTSDAYTEAREARKGYNNYESPKGAYDVDNLFRKETNMDLMLSYKKNLSKDWNLNAFAGASRMEQNSREIYINATQMVVPGLYTISNGVPGTVSYTSAKYKKQIYGVYGMGSLGYKSRVYLDITARNDWSSTLPKANRSYFYPSASLSMILSDMVKMPGWVKFAKFRVGSAQVGNDVAPYSLNQTYSTAADWGAAKRMYMDGQLKNSRLKPEISTSHEAGVDIRLFNDRIGLDATYYIARSKNQVLSIGLPSESGATSQLINAGLIESKGWDIRLTTVPVSSGDFRWEMNFNFSRNRTSIKELANGITYFPFVSYNGAEVRTYTGGQIGDIYMLPMLTVNDKSSPYNGYPILTNDGKLQTDNDVNHMMKIGNFNHDFMLGIQPTFSYKSFSLYVNIDWRQGGSYYSNTMMFLGNNGQLDETFSGVPYDKSKGISDQIKANPKAYLGNWIGGRNEEYGGFAWTGSQASIRKQDASFNPGVRQVVTNGNISYVENLGGADTKWLDPFNAYRYANRPFPDRNLYSATYVKLREISLAYRLPRNFTHRLKLQGASVSLVASNLFEWTAAHIAIDPERAFRQDGAVWTQGVEYYNVMPWTTSVGCKLNVDF